MPCADTQSPAQFHQVEDTRRVDKLMRCLCYISNELYKSNPTLYRQILNSNVELLTVLDEHMER